MTTLQNLPNRLRLNQLRLLAAIAETGSLLAAAHRLHVSQPAATKTLKQLEELVGDTLVVRSATGSVLTPIGEVLCRRARLVISGLKDVDDELRRFRTGLLGQVVVGALPVATSTLLPRALASAARDTPGLTVRVIEGSSDIQFPRLKEGHLDLVVGRYWPSNDPDLSNEVLFESRFAAAVRPGHPLTVRRRPRLEHLARFPWILPPPGAHSRTALEEMFRHARSPLPAHPVETTSYLVIRSLLRATDMVCPLDVETPGDDVASGALALLPTPIDVRVPPVGVVHVASRPLSPAAKALVEHLRSAVATLAAPPGRTGRARR